MHNRSREERVVDVLVELGTRTNGCPFAPVEFLHALVTSSLDLLDAAEVGVLLGPPGRELRAAASSNEDAAALELLQCQDREGPCSDCCRSGRPVSSADLTHEEGRWPTFSRRAVDAGFASVHAVPMRIGGLVVGAVNLFRDRPGRLSVADLRLAQGIADLGAARLVHEQTVRDIQDRVDHLEIALTSRVVIEQAKGILAERLDMSPDSAFQLLRSYARSRNLRLSDVADDLIRGRVPLAAFPLDSGVEN